MSVTEEQIKALTPQHRIVWHLPPGQPVEMGLYEGSRGGLYTDAGHLLLWRDGGTGRPGSIVRIIPPAFVPRVGMVIGHPNIGGRRLIHTGDDTDTPWLGYAPEVNRFAPWFTSDEARDLIESHDWEVMGDLAAPGEVTDKQVEAAARALAGHFGAGGDGWSVWADEARAALEAAREVRND